MTRMTPLIIYAVFVLLVTVLGSCEKDCLCHFAVDGSSRANAEVDVDWSLYGNEKVSGMTVACYSEDATSPQRVLTNDITKAQFLLQENFYDVLVISHSEGEYGSLRFCSMDSYHRASVEAVPYGGSHWLGNDVRVIAEPEWLAVGKMEDAVVSCQMVAESSGMACSCNNCCCETIHSGKSVSLGTIVPENVIYSFDVKVNIDGMHNLKSVRASVSGLADSHCLSSGKNGTADATQVLLSWRTQRESPGAGFIESSFRTFGLPSADACQTFDLQLMLVDGKTIVKNSIDITDLIDIDKENKSISLVLTLAEPLPDTKSPSGGGFDASVNGWDEAGDVDIIL